MSDVRAPQTATTTAKDAALFDAHVVPRYSSLFGRLLLGALPARERLQVLDVGCGTGHPSLQILSRLGEGGRVIAMDRDAALVDLARRKALDASGRRIFFQVAGAEELSFGDEVFDVVTGNLALASFREPERALAEIRRVLVKGGRLLLTHPLAGTFEEVFDIFSEVALRSDDNELSARVDRILGGYPTPSMLEAVAANAGFEDARVITEEFQLPFESAARVFDDPMMRFIGAPTWQWIAGSGADAAKILDEAARTLDTYFGSGPLTVRVNAGLLSARA